MIRALVWKEAREQGLIVSALAVLGAAVLLAVGLLNPPAGRERPFQQLLTDPGFLSLLALVVTAGTVVGGTLFAGEKEAGTYPYLIGLPVPRWRVWAGKVCGGAVLVLAVAAPLFAVAAAVGIVGPPNTLAAWGLACGAVVLAALGWGSVGSVLARNSLAASGLGALFAVLASTALFPLAWIVVIEIGRWARQLAGGGFDGRSVATVAALLALFAVFAAPFLVSLWAFTEPDRNRKYRAVFGPTGKRKGRPAFRPLAWVGNLGGFKAAVWLTWRQTRLAAVILGGVGLASGTALLVPGTPLAAAWPPATLFLAVLVGVIGWADEQGSGAGRFWVERRTPVGRLWAAKVVGGLLLTFAVTLAVAVPTLLKYAALSPADSDRGSRLLFGFGFPLWKYLLVWPVYGFAFGHLVGLLFRKTLVAVSVAAMVGAVAAAVWLPSLLAGGVRHWQLWLPPLLALATARALVWSMAADRVGTRRALGRLAVGGLAVAVAVGGGVAYRVLEIPDAPERADDLAYRSDIPPFETNDAGREIRRAAVILFDLREGRADGRLPASPGEPVAVTRRSDEPTPITYTYHADDPFRGLPDPWRRKLEAVLEHGWRPDAGFERWLDGVFAAGWAEVLEAAVALPLGTVEDPIELTLNSPLRHLEGLRGADALLLVQALRRQADGDPEAFVRAYETVLGLSRNMRNKSILACALAGRQMERRAHQALQRWLEKLHGRPDLLAGVGCALAQHDAWATDDAADVRLAEQVVLRNTVTAPGEVLKRDWKHGERAADSETARRVMDAETELVGFAWQVPWERERLSRLVGLGNKAAYPAAWNTWADDAWETVFPPKKARGDFDAVDRFPFSGLPGVGWPPPQVRSWNLKGQHGLAEMRVATDRRAARLLLALRQYQLDRGAVPKALDDLVPAYLPVVPLDPWDGRPFRYRVAADGEAITVEGRTPAPPGDEPAVLPPAEEMAWSSNPLNGRVAAGMAMPPAVVSELVDPLPAVVGAAAPVAVGLSGAQLAVERFVQRRAGVTAVTGFAAALDNYLPLSPLTATPPSGPHRWEVKLPPGTGVLWSVGPDKIDQGGTATHTTPFIDWVYVVPPVQRE